MVEKRSLRDIMHLGAYYAREDGLIEDHQGNILRIYADGTVFVRPDYSNWQRIPAHRLIAMAFVSNPLKYPYVIFVDRNKANRKPENLEWSPSKSVRRSLDPITRESGKLKSEQIRDLLKQHKSVREIRAIVGASEQYIRKIRDDWEEDAQVCVEERALESSMNIFEH